MLLGHHDHGLEAGHLLAAEAARAAGGEAGHDLHHHLVVVLGLEAVRGHQTPHSHLQLECLNVSTKIRGNFHNIWRRQGLSHKENICK